MGAGESSQFPFKVGQEQTGYRNALWKMYDGTKSASGEAVSIFTFNKSIMLDGTSYLPVAQNALQKLRTLRHPNVLRFIDGVELPNSLHIVTEPVRPFSLDDPDVDSAGSAETKKQHHETSLTLGLHQIITAVTWLNCECHMIHGNVQQSSIFMTKGGDWKLGGLDLVTPHSPLSNVFQTFQTYSSVLPNKLKAPELADRKFSAIEKGPVTAIDAWTLGCLIYECFNTTLTSAEQLSQLGAIPKSIQTEYKRLLHTNPAQRLLPSMLLNTKLFDNDLVKRVTFVDSLALKSTAEKEAFFQEFSVDELPLRCAKYKILPQLINALEYGSGLSCFGVVLNSVLQIGASLNSEEYTAIVIPAIVKLFSSQERQVRVNLLQHLSEYSKYLSKELVNDKIFSYVLAGFTDSLPSLRELTVRSMAVFAPQLSEATLDSQVLKCLITCQNDQIPTVRQNTTYVLAKIAGFLSESSREKYLLPSFARALKDPYPPARLASITSMGATLEYHHPPACAQKILPMLSLMCLDPEVTVRQAALQCCQRVLAKLEAFSTHLSQQQAASAQPGASDKNASSTQANSGSGWLSYVTDVSQKVVTTATSSLGAAKTAGRPGETSTFTPSPNSASSSRPSSAKPYPSSSPSSASLPSLSSCNNSNSSSSSATRIDTAKKPIVSVSNNMSNSNSSSRNSLSSVSNVKAEIDSSSANGWGDDSFFEDVVDDDAPTVDLSLSTKKKPGTATSSRPPKATASKIAAISAEIADDPLGNWDAPIASLPAVVDDSDPWGLGPSIVPSAVKPVKTDEITPQTKPAPSSVVRPTALPKKVLPKAVPVTITLPKPAGGPKMDNWEDFLNS